MKIIQFSSFDRVLFYNSGNIKKIFSGYFLIIKVCVLPLKIQTILSKIKSSFFSPPLSLPLLSPKYSFPRILINSWVYIIPNLKMNFTFNSKYFYLINNRKVF